MSAVIDDVEIVYPESDGKPMADNTLQWDWMVRIVSELREMYAGQEVFVAGDLFWYPVQGNPRIVTAPDGLVVFGRPPGFRGSYRQWEEEGIAPQVVFEILSPNNTEAEMQAKFLFYERYGVEEYYVIDPDEPSVQGYFRQDNSLIPVTRMHGYISPRLKVRFEEYPDEVKMFTPSGREFQDRNDRIADIEAELARTAEAFEVERQRAIESQRITETYRNKLRELGIDPDTVSPN